MVTSQNGVQFAVFICLLWCSFSTAKGVLAIRRSKSYEIPENLEAFPDDLTSAINFDLLNAINADDEAMKISVTTTHLPPSQSNEELIDESLINFEDDRWLSQRPQRSHSFLQDFTDRQIMPLKPPNQEEYGWKLGELQDMKEMRSSYGSESNDLQSLITREGDSIPFHFLVRSPTPAEVKEVAKKAQKGKIIRKFLYNSSPPPKVYRSRKGLIIETPPIVKRWAWAGGYYRARSQMDRRAVPQSKHYGCLKRCISIGKLHPIQCHTLC